MTIIRLCRSRYSPKDATGSKLHGGRWNSPGNGVLYASATLSLACLEVLVHIRDVGLLPPDYLYCEIEVQERLITPWTLTGEESLAKIESSVLSREFGDSWFAREAASKTLQATLGDEYPRNDVKPTPVQAVPSVIIPREMNYLINPTHSEFDQLIWREPQPFRLDPRLLSRAAE